MLHKMLPSIWKNGSMKLQAQDSEKREIGDRMVAWPPEVDTLGWDIWSEQHKDVAVHLGEH